MCFFTWLLRVSADTQTYDVPGQGYRLVEVAVCKEGALWSAPNAGPAWWDVVLRRWSPAVDHGSCDRPVEVPRAGGRGLLLTVEQLVQRRVFESGTVVSTAAVISGGLRFRLFLFLHLLFVVFLPIHVHAEAYGAVGVCRGERGGVAGAMAARQKCFQSCHKDIDSKVLRGRPRLPHVVSSILQTRVPLWWWRVTVGPFSRGCGGSSNRWRRAALCPLFWIKTYWKKMTEMLQKHVQLDSKKLLSNVIYFKSKNNYWQYYFRTQCVAPVSGENILERIIESQI